MSIGTLIAAIGGIITAGCAIAGVIAGIRARRAQERRNEELREVEHRDNVQTLRERLAARRQARRQQAQPTQPVAYQTYATTPNEIHHYYYGAPQPQYPQQVVQTPIPGTYQQIQQPQYYQNSYVQPGYAYGYQSNDSVYPIERAIGNMSKMQMYQNSMQPYQNNYVTNYYYPKAHYAYA